MLKKLINYVLVNLKDVGLSRQKVRGIKELAVKFENKSFDPNKIKFMSDEEYNLFIIVKANRKMVS